MFTEGAANATLNEVALARCSDHVMHDVPMLYRFGLGYDFVYFFFLLCSEVVECEEFLSLTHDQVIRLISSDKLQTPAEEKVRIMLLPQMYIFIIYRHGVSMFCNNYFWLICCRQTFSFIHITFTVCDEVS